MLTLVLADRRHGVGGLAAGSGRSCSGAARQLRRDASSGARSTTRFERIQAMFSDISSRVQENLAGVRVIRAYVQEEARDCGNSRCSTASTSRENIRLARAQGMFMPVLQALVGLGFLACCGRAERACCQARSRSAAS